MSDNVAAVVITAIIFVAVGAWWHAALWLAGRLFGFRVTLHRRVPKTAPKVILGTGPRRIRDEGKEA